MRLNSQLNAAGFVELWRDPANGQLYTRDHAVNVMRSRRNELRDSTSPPQGVVHERADGIATFDDVASPRTQESDAQELLLRVWRDWKMFDNGKSEYWNPSVSLFDDVKGWAELRESEAPPESKGLTVADYEEVLADKRRLVRELDVIWNGDGAAKQASLCDVVAQIEAELPELRKRSEAPHQPSPNSVSCPYCRHLLSRHFPSGDTHECQDCLSPDFSAIILEITNKCQQIVQGEIWTDVLKASAILRREWTGKPC